MSGIKTRHKLLHPLYPWQALCTRTIVYLPTTKNISKKYFLADADAFVAMPRRGLSVWGTAWSGIHTAAPAPVLLIPGRPAQQVDGTAAHTPTQLLILPHSCSYSCPAQQVDSTSAHTPWQLLILPHSAHIVFSSSAAQDSMQLFMLRHRFSSLNSSFILAFLLFGIRFIFESLLV